MSPCGGLPARKPVKKLLTVDQSYILVWTADLDFVHEWGKKNYTLCIISLVHVWTGLLSRVTAGFLKVNNSL